jgi:hypothetical protein
MSKTHLDALAFIPRLEEALCPHEPSRPIAGILVNIPRHLSGDHIRTASQFKAAYCIRRNLPRRTFAARVDDKVLSKMIGISVAGAKQARKTLERRGWIVECLTPNSNSFMGDYLAEQRDTYQRTTARSIDRGPSISSIGQQRWLDQRQRQ